MRILRLITQDVIHSLYFICRKKIGFFSLVLYLCFSHSLTIAQVCKADSRIIKDMQAIACATPDLREAVEKGNLLDKISAINFFATLTSSDIRSVENLSFINRSLRYKIAEAHTERQKAGRESYTLHITSLSHRKKG